MTRQEKIFNNGKSDDLIGTQQVSCMRAESPGLHAWCPPEEGTWSPALGEPLTPNRDEATALVVEFSERQLQRLNSWDHLPPDFASDLHQSRAPVMFSPSTCGPHPEVDR